jgi:glutamine synthetase
VDIETARTSSPTRRGETEAFLNFIGGMKHLGAAVALFAPYVNSYRRYVPTLAPIILEWGRDNRTTGLRVPISGPAARRWKTACPAWTATPISASPPRWPAAIWA